jgi:excisionase family DNA binding protein
MTTYTTKEAAERLGLEVSHVRRLLEEGKIKGKKFGRDWMVLSLDYQRRRASKREKGETNEKR